MFESIKKGFHDQWIGSEEEYQRIITDFRSQKEYIESSFKEDIAAEKLEALINETQVNINKLQGKYYSQAEQYLNKAAENQKTLEELEKYKEPKMEQVMRDMLELFVLGREVSSMDQEQIKEVYVNSNAHSKRLILAELKRQEEPNTGLIKYLQELTPINKIDSLRGVLRSMQARYGQFYTERLISHDINKDLGVFDIKRKQYFSQ